MNVHVRQQGPGQTSLGPGCRSTGTDDLALMDIMDAVIESDDSGEEDILEPTTSGRQFFSSSDQVFVVERLSKILAGFRPSIVCDGYLAEVGTKRTGCMINPLGREQKLSFKYEPPSPKFSHGTQRADCVSYRLQLLQGAQFLCSLRGLPKTIRCRRASGVLEWGAVHMVFSATEDLDTFLSTLKYVDVLEVKCCGTSGPSQLGTHRRSQDHSHNHMKEQPHPQQQQQQRLQQQQQQQQHPHHHHQHQHHHHHPRHRHHHSHHHSHQQSQQHLLLEGVTAASRSRQSLTSPSSGTAACGQGTQAGVSGRPAPTSSSASRARCASPTAATDTVVSSRRLGATEGRSSSTATLPKPTMPCPLPAASVADAPSPRTTTPTCSLMTVRGGDASSRTGRCPASEASRSAVARG